MKILFHNYTNSLSTEPLYLFHALQQAGVESSMWSDQRVSAYDAFDSQKPDVFVTHFKTFTNDIFTYLKNSRKCDLVLNVTGASQQQLASIEAALNENQIKCPVIFTNSFSKKLQTNLNLVDIYPAADIFNLSQKGQADGSLEEAVISNKFDENVENYIGQKEVFHLLYITEDEGDPNFDARVNVRLLPRMYQMYKEVTLVGDSDLCCSQLFFDAALNANRLNVRNKDQEEFNKMLSNVFSDTSTGADVDIVKELKSQIKSRHTPFHRAWRLMKFLGNKDAMAKVDKLKNQTTQILENF